MNDANIDIAALLLDLSEAHRPSPKFWGYKNASRSIRRHPEFLSDLTDKEILAIRQDLDYRVATAAKKAGCVFALDSDAHAADQLWMADYALAHAGLAGIPARHIINCWAAADILRWARTFPHLATSKATAR